VSKDGIDFFQITENEILALFLYTSFLYMLKMIVVCLQILKTHKGNVPVSLKSIPQSITSNYYFVLKKNGIFLKAYFVP